MILDTLVRRVSRNSAMKNIHVRYILRFLHPRTTFSQQTDSNINDGNQNESFT